MQVKVSAVAIIYSGDDILFLKRFPYDRSFPDIYCLPGGKVDDGEILEEALYREVKEETNLDIINHSPVGVHTFDNGQKAFEMHMFICEVEGKIKISHEHESWEFLNIETTNRKIGENTIVALKRYLGTN